MKKSVNDPLAEALNAAINNEGEWADFYSCLMSSDIFFLELPAADSEIVSDGTALTSFLIIDDSEGQPFIPFFSSMQELENSFADYDISGLERVAMAAPHFLIATKEHRIALNPMTAGKEFNPGEVEHLLENINGCVEEITMPAGSEYLIGEPADYPHELITGLRILFDKYPGVSAAYLAQVIFKQGENHAPPQYVIGIETPTLDVFEKVMAASGRIIERVKLSQPLSFTPVNQSPEDGFSKFMKKEIPPFYPDKLDS